MTQRGLGLSRELWLVMLGIFLNYVGYGAVLPFEIIYLHDGRGFSLNIAGLVVAMLSGVAVVTAPLAGPLIDRFGAKPVATIAGLALAAGYAGLAFAQTPVVAFAAAILAGAGNGALNPSQSTLLVALTPPDVRHRSTAVSRVASNAGIGLGGALGGFIAIFGLTGYVWLYLINAITYIVYIGILVAVVGDTPRGDTPRSDTPRSDGERPEPMLGGYRLVLRDRAFMHLALNNVAIIAVGWGVFTWLVPPYAKEVIGLSPQLIGLMLFANAVTVVAAQLPIARFAEGRRRAVMMALGALSFFGACLLVIAAGFSSGTIAYAALLTASVAVALGECFHTSALMPLVADLAPTGLRGRYMAAMGLSWWVGLALAPALGTQVLSLSPLAAFLGSAALAFAAAVSSLALEPRLPQESRLTPQPR